MKKGLMLFVITLFSSMTPTCNCMMRVVRLFSTNSRPLFYKDIRGSLKTIFGVFDECGARDVVCNPDHLGSLSLLLKARKIINYDPYRDAPPFFAKVVYYENAIRIKPEYADAHRNYGITLLQMGREEKAVYHLKKEVQINPNDTVAANALKKLQHPD